MSEFVCVRVSKCVYLSVHVCVCYDIGGTPCFRSVSGHQGVLYCLVYQLAPTFLYINKSCNENENSSFFSSIIQVSFKLFV